MLFEGSDPFRSRGQGQQSLITSVARFWRVFFPSALKRTGKGIFFGRHGFCSGLWVRDLNKRPYVLIVLVDDDKSFLRSLTLLLEKAGHQVSAFSDPKEAVLFLEREKNIDALFVDLVMRPFSGEDFLREALRFLSEDTVRFVISGYLENIEGLDREKLKVKACFQKPPDIKAILAALSEIESEKGRGLKA